MQTVAYVEHIRRKIATYREEISLVFAAKLIMSRLSTGFNPKRKRAIKRPEVLLPKGFVEPKEG